MSEKQEAADNEVSPEEKIEEQQEKIEEERVEKQQEEIKEENNEEVKAKKKFKIFGRVRK